MFGFWKDLAFVSSATICGCIAGAVMQFGFGIG